MEGSAAAQAGPRLILSSPQAILGCGCPPGRWETAGRGGGREPGRRKESRSEAGAKESKGASKASWEPAQSGQEEKQTIDKDASPFGVEGSAGGNTQSKNKEGEIKGKKKLNRA